jgi:regulation of enolase protein 1 (concanavalin A-like superfamily)
MKTNTRLLLLGVITASLAIFCVARAQTVVWSDNFDDGNGNNRWYGDNGVWQIGTPTAGPGTAHSTAYCAGTGLTANYADNASSRLIRMQSFTVPPASQYPRLRFWQWYSFANSDYGVVEVSTNNGTTWSPVSPNYAGPYVDGWTCPSIDLSSYAGQTVKLAFHVVDVDGNGTQPGWYVDDISLVTGTPVFNNPEGWENGIGDWYAETGVWQVGVPKSGPGAAHSGTKCAATVLNGNYNDGTSSRLISPAITIPPASQYPRLRFWQWYSFANSDYGEVEVSTNNGTTWSPVSPNYAGPYVDGWTCPSIDLSSYAGQTVKLAFHVVDVDGNGTQPGWYVDDISLVTGTPVFNNPEGWENGIGDWYAETGIWQVGVPKSGPGAAHSGTKCAGTALNGNYNDGTSSRLISPAFTIPPASSSPYLRFWQWYSFANSDYGVVEIRIGTNAWQQISSHFSGSSAGWFYSPPIDLTSFGGDTMQLAFEVVQVDGNGSQPGWFVDDVLIQSPGKPVILTPPASQTVYVGTSVTMYVGAGGDSPLIYQWRFNSNSIAGATNTSLTITNAQLANTGYYDVVITNLSGSVTSTPPALLQVVIAFTAYNIGDPGASGSFTNSNGTYTVTGSGEGTDGSADVFYFVSQALAGDAQIIARLQSLQGGDTHFAEAGIMVRESLDPGSKQASLMLNASTNLIFVRRLATNSTTIPSAFSATNYVRGANYLWLRLTRLGNTFVAHYSTNGLNWQYMWFTTMTMSNQVQVGLGVTAHNYGQLTTAVFDNVMIGSPTTLGAWPLSGTKFLTGGQNWSPAELQRVGGFEFLLGGVVGEYDNIKATTNLAAPFASWPTLATVTNTYGVVPILDPGALTNKMKYYRAQKIGP